MQSKQILLPDAQCHEAFLRSAQFAPELARIPFKWRNRVITAAMAKMVWSSWYKVYESIATSFVREFAEQYVPAGVDLSQSDADIVATAERAADGVTKMLWMAVSDTHALQIMEDECASYGIELPEFDALTDTIARLVDARWWRRQLRKRVKRAFEAGNIRLGYVKYSGEPYASNDAVLSRLAQNRRNAAALAATLVQNENGQQFSIAELAEKTTANKAIRRGELMLRINGFEQIARECGDQGIFITWTCPSRFHAMQHSGKPNDKFDGSTPREANAYLGKMTSLCRSALARRGIGLYGFRIAEPHRIRWMFNRHSKQRVAPAVTSDILPSIVCVLIDDSSRTGTEGSPSESYVPASSRSLEFRCDELQYRPHHRSIRKTQQGQACSAHKTTFRDLA